jgi:hypothetical protein
MDSFIATKKEVFDIIHQLFASKEATERFNSMPHVKIKEWIVRWVADADIVRPIKKITKKLTKEEQAFRKAEKKNTADANAAMRVRYKQMNLDEKRIHNNLEKEKKALEKKQKEEKEEAALASALEARTLATSTGEEVLEEAVEDDSNEFSDLKVFHGCGVRKSFYFQALHRDGLGIRLSACHCHFCTRGYFGDGFGTMPTGCLSQEPYQYIVVQRLDDEWVKEKKELVTNLSSRLGTLELDMIVALASDRVDNWKKSTSSSCKHISFDIARVVAQVEPGEEGEMYRVNIYTQLDGGNHYECKDALQNAIVSHCRVRYILADNILQDNGTILVDKDCLEAIVFNCFNGVREESL